VLIDPKRKHVAIEVIAAHCEGCSSRCSNLGTDVAPASRVADAFAELAQVI
jgi:hypothetical protein